MVFVDVTWGIILLQELCDYGILSQATLWDGHFTSWGRMQRCPPPLTVTVVLLPDPKALTPWRPSTECLRLSTQPVRSSHNVPLPGPGSAVQAGLWSSQVSIHLAKQIHDWMGGMVLGPVSTSWEAQETGHQYWNSHNTGTHVTRQLWLPFNSTIHWVVYKQKFPILLEAGVLDQGASMSKLSWGRELSRLQTANFLLHPHMVESRRLKQAFLVTIIRALIPTWQWSLHDLI